MSGPGEGGPPPWIDDRMQRLIVWRDGDILVSVPITSGTTWTMNIVHQLLTGSDADFVDIYVEVPWLELLQRPGQPAQEVLDRVAAVTKDRRRAFKTHAAQPTLPYLESGGGKDLRYIAAAACVSRYSLPRMRPLRERRGLAIELSRLYGHLDLHLLSELVEHDHQPVDRESAKLPFVDAREVSMIDPGPRLGLAH